ncbi:MAG TPA: HPP family protein [Candidatus Limnocylindria bacterium]|jgi:CBS-domain-containing membrane protein|nr:HPP family protein [Candidatus Limnocylindria bacterium]
MIGKHWNQVLHGIGVEFNPVPHREKLVSGVGAFLAILVTILICRHFLDVSTSACIVTSMGASAVLLFGMPHGALSQPWPFLGGQLLSALTGVLCQRFIADPMIAGALAVGIAVTLMHYLRCIHPPGGATALAAVIGGPAVHQLGFKYILTPVTLNALALLTLAILINGTFAWRRYPAAFARKSATPDLIPRESLEFALQKMGSFIDASEDDLEEIYSIAVNHAKGLPFTARQSSPQTSRLATSGRNAR